MLKYHNRYHDTETLYIIKNNNLENVTLPKNANVNNQIIKCYCLSYRYNHGTRPLFSLRCYILPGHVLYRLCETHLAGSFSRATVRTVATSFEVTVSGGIKTATMS